MRLVVTSKPIPIAFKVLHPADAKEANPLLAWNVFSYLRGIKINQNEQMQESAAFTPSHSSSSRC